MAATKPQQKLSDICVLAAQAGLGIGLLEQGNDQFRAPLEAFSRALSGAAGSWPKVTDLNEKKLLWALPRALRKYAIAPADAPVSQAFGALAGIPLYEPAEPAPATVAKAAITCSQLLYSASRGELQPDETRDAKLLCLRISDALGLSSKTLNFG